MIVSVERESESLKLFRRQTEKGTPRDGLSRGSPRFFSSKSGLAQLSHKLTGDHLDALLDEEEEAW